MSKRMLPKAVVSVVSTVLMLTEVTGYVPYWPEYWNPNQHYKDYPVHSKYQYPVHKDTYLVHKDTYPVHKDTYLVHKDTYPVHKDTYPVHKDTYPDYYPPPAPKPRGEEAYPGVFLGMGTINAHFGGRQVELICSLTDADGEIVSNVVWHKVKGAYSPPSFPGAHPPPFECRKCSFFPVNYDDHRIKAYDYNGKSILFIHEVHQDDYGLYRCSATSQRNYEGDTETVFQIVKL